MHIDGRKERKGSAGRPADAIADEHTPYASKNITMPQELLDRLDKYCDDEERARSWAVQKAIDKWLSERGY